MFYYIDITKTVETFETAEHATSEADGSVKSDLKVIREQVGVHFNQWYGASIAFGKDVDVDRSMPRISNRQQHRNNLTKISVHPSHPCSKGTLFKCLLF